MIRVFCDLCGAETQRRQPDVADVDEGTWLQVKGNQIQLRVTVRVGPDWKKNDERERPDLCAECIRQAVIQVMLPEAAAAMKGEPQ